MAFASASHTDARNASFYDIGGHQYNFVSNNHIHRVAAEGAGSDSSGRPSLPLSFNDAPDLLSDHFTGREHELDHIGRVLDAVHGNVPTRIAIHGMPGLGKTQLALQYAKMSYDRQRYFMIFWISATTIEKLNHGFANVLDLVGHPDRDHPQQSTRLSAARRWLEEPNANTSTKWLLVLDNVDRETVGFLREHLPRKNSRGNVLFTTRTESVADAMATAAGDRHETFELQALDPWTAASLLIRSAGVEADVGSLSGTAEAVVKCVACLPLAVAQAASFMKQSRSSLDDLLHLYRGDDRFQMISWENDLSTYEAKSVAATFCSQLEQLERQHPDVSSLLKILSFFDPESIPLNIITDGAETWLSRSGQVSWHPDGVTGLSNETLATRQKLESLDALIRSPVQLHSAIQQLQNLSLVTSTNGSALRIHDLIQFTIRETVRREDTHRRWFDVAALLACSSFRRIDDPESYKSWAECEKLGPHIQSLTKWDDAHTIGNPELLDANHSFSIYLRSQGRYIEAEQLCRWTLARNKNVLGLEHPDTLRTMHCLAIVYEQQGRYKEAEELYGRVLASREKLLGFEHPDTLATMHNLANVYIMQGRYKEAEELDGRVLPSREKLLGFEHPDTLRTMHSLAIVYEQQGRYKEAEELYGRVLASRKKLLGFEHPDTLTMMHNLADVYQMQGRCKEAEELYGRVLASREKLLGFKHPDTLATMHNLAIVYESQERYKEAEELYSRVLASHEKLLGFEHPDTLATMYNLAILYGRQGRYKEAEELYGRVLPSREKLLGFKHPATLATMDGLAVLFTQQGRYDEAEVLFRRALAGQQKVLGPEHPDTLLAVRNLTGLYHSLGRHNEVEALQGGPWQP